MKTRRNFLVVSVAGLALLAVPPTVIAQQQGKVWRIGFLSAQSRQAQSESIAIFLRAMRNHGYVEGKHFVMEWRFAEGKLDRLPALSAELVQSKVDVIVAVSSFCVEAARKATTTIPIVMTGAGDPVASGFVASLAHPGGNITGISNVSVVVSSKYLELLNAAVPKLTRVAVLINPSHPNHPTVLKQVQEGGKAIGATVVPFEASNSAQIEQAFLAIGRDKVGAMIVPSDSVFSSHMRQIVALGAKVPPAHDVRDPSRSGGGRSMSYHPHPAEMYERPAAMVDKILKGAKPAIFRSSCRPASVWWLISGPPRRLALRSRSRSWCARTG